MSKGAQMAVIRKLISWRRLMSWKSMETDVLARVRWVGNRSKSVLADLLPPRWTPRTRNVSMLSLNLRYTSLYSPFIFIQRLFSFQRREHEESNIRKKRGQFNGELCNYPKLVRVHVTRGSRGCKFTAKTLSFELVKFQSLTSSVLHRVPTSLELFLLQLLICFNLEPLITIFHGPIRSL